MNEVMTGEATGAQIAALIVALRAKGEDAGEVAGLVDAMKAHAVAIDIPGPTLDVVGTGGDQAHTVNLSTMAAVVAAAAGARVVKHGSRAASSLCGSADVLDALGVASDLPPSAVVRCVDELGIGFCLAPRFHPALRYAASPRRELGIPTVFNVMGPLANPANPTAALVGCADLRLAPVMAAVLADADRRALVVRGEDGLDEVSTAGLTRVWDATSANGDITTGFIDAQALGFEIPACDALRGGDAERNAHIVRAVFAGVTDGSMQAVRDAVVLNAATALVADAAGRGVIATMDLTERVRGQLERAQRAIDSGAALSLLDRWVALSRHLSSTGDSSAR